MVNLRMAGQAYSRLLEFLPDEAPSTDPANLPHGNNPPPPARHVFRNSTDHAVPGQHVRWWCREPLRE
jgi:hypothetical protein